MNILIFYQKKPYFPECGGSNRVWNLAKALVKLDNEVTVIFPSQKQRLEENIDDVKLIGVPLSKSPIFKDYFYNSFFSLFFEFIKLENEKNIDVIYCELLYLFPVVFFTKLFNKPIILDEFAVEYESHKTDYNVGNPLSKKALERIRNLEKFALDNSSLVLACSETDALKFKNLYNLDDNKLKIIENGIDISSFDQVKPHRFRKPTVLFVGDAKYPPNAQAQSFLVEAVVPLVLKKEKYVQFVFVTKTIPSFLKKSKYIKIFSKLKDSRPFVKGATICLAPIFHGTGTRIKILEYMAGKKPVVSTAKGSEGLAVIDNENILIRNSAWEFAQAIVELLADSVKRELLGQKAYELVKQQYDIFKISQKLDSFHHHLRSEEIKNVPLGHAPSEASDQALNFLNNGLPTWFIDLNLKKGFKFYFNKYLGLIGLFLKNNFPKLYFILKKLKDIRLKN